MFQCSAKKAFQQLGPAVLSKTKPLSRILGGGAQCKFSSSIRRIGTSDPRMSKVVVHNKVVYTSGLVDLEGDGVKEQTKNVLAEVDELLEEAGTSKSNLLTASIWLKDIETDFADMNEVWVDWMDPQNKPVRATVESPMARPEILVEIQVTAAAGTD